MNLDDTLGKTIADFCRNKFIDDGDNHCAHYVCHVLDLAVGYTCKAHKNGSHPAAGLRVQELFTACPVVGLFAQGPQDGCIVFVTDKANVDLAAHHMANVPKKHVGILANGYVYNYGNTTDEVVRQTPPKFLERFQGTYGGNQALFFGTFPPGTVLPTNGATGGPPAAAEAVPAAVVPASVAGPTPTIREVPASNGAKDYFAKFGNGSEVYVGRSTKYGSYRGLFQPAGKLHGPTYRIGDYAPRYETVAAIVGVIGAGESSGYFNRINTYDRAACTFGFFQLAAHTPGDNLILLFRRLAAESTKFQALFPDLKVVEGKLHRALTDGHTVSLEKQYPRPGKPNELELADFMRYLNPDGSQIDQVELECAAKLTHLATTDTTVNDIQVNVAAEITMRKLRERYATWYGLDGAADVVCAAIADIHHQGRGKKTEVKAALNVGTSVKKQVEALCKIGCDSYAERCTTLKKALAQATQDGHLGISVFDRASGLFKPSTGWPD